MNWAVLIPIIAQYGLPFAESVFQKWTSGNPPTQSDFDQLRTMLEQTAKDRMTAALQRAGIASDSDQGKALLANAQTI